MPFRRRRTRRRTRRRPTALRAVRRLARFVDTELHQALVVDDTNTVTAGGPSFVPLVAVAQGDDDSDRNGLQITLRRLHMRFTVERGNTDSLLRVIVFRDRQSNGLTPTLNQVLQRTATVTEAMVSPKSNDFRRRFTFLSDRIHQVSLGRGEQIQFRVSHKLSNKVIYSDDLAIVASVQSGMIWLLMLSSGAGGAASPTISSISRIWFAP